jgi:hypothetical protein
MKIAQDRLNSINQSRAHRNRGALTLEQANLAAADAPEGSSVEFLVVNDFNLEGQRVKLVQTEELVEEPLVYVPAFPASNPMKSPDPVFSDEVNAEIAKRQAAADEKAAAEAAMTPEEKAAAAKAAAAKTHPADKKAVKHK